MLVIALVSMGILSVFSDSTNPSAGRAAGLIVQADESLFPVVTVANNEVLLNPVDDPLQKIFRALFEDGVVTEETLRELKAYVTSIEQMDAPDKLVAVVNLYRFSDRVPESTKKNIPWDLIPEMISDFRIDLTHKHDYTKVENDDTIEMVDSDDKRYQIEFNNAPSASDNLFSAEPIALGDKAYVDVSLLSTIEKNAFAVNRITGNQVLGPDSPNYNQVPRRFAVLALSATPAQVIWLNTKLNDVYHYFLENSDGLAQFSFDVYPVSWGYISSINAIHPFDVINIADSQVNFNNYDSVLVVFFGSAWRGYATASLSSPTSVFSYTTPQGESISSAISVYELVYNTPDPSNVYLHLFAHEVGHNLRVFDPNLFAIPQQGYLLPHSARLSDPNLCYPNGNLMVCFPGDYHDSSDIMGHGRGLFHHHMAVKAGLRSTSSEVTVSSSGLYQLCDINHAFVPGCPQSLTIQNPVGADANIEFRTAVGFESFYTANGCSGSFFDGLILRAVNTEKGPYGNNVFANIYQFGPYGTSHNRDVVIPYSTASTLCPSSILGGFSSNYVYGLFMMDYPIPLGQSMQTPIGTVTPLAPITTLPSGVRQMSVQVNYAPTPCVPGLLSAQLIPMDGLIRLYANTLWPVVQGQSYNIVITNNDFCSQNQDFTIGVVVIGYGITYSYQSAPVTVSIPPGTSASVPLPIPSALANAPSSYNTWSITVTQHSVPSQTITLPSTGQLLSYSPTIYGPFGVSSCTDNDQMSFSVSNLGANYATLAPNSGASVVLNPPINGITSLNIPDFCLHLGSLGSPSSSPATDIVCSNAPGFPPGAPDTAWMVVQDCRFVTGPDSICMAGQCI